MLRGGGWSLPQARSNTLLLLPGLWTLGLLGCASAPTTVPRAALPPPRAATLGEVQAAYDGYCRGLEALSASGDLELRDARTGKTGRVHVRLVASRGGRLYLKGSVAVVTALEVVSNGERFWLQVPSKKTVWTGLEDAPAEVAEGGQAPYYALRPRDVTLALLPEPIEAAPGDIVVMEGERGTFSLTVARTQDGAGLARRRVVMSRDSLQPLELWSFDEKGDVTSLVRLGAWREGLPREVAISRPLEGYWASLSLDKLEKNGSIPERAFQPRTPAGYKVVEVR